MCATSLGWVISGIFEVSAEIVAVQPDALPAPRAIAWFYEWTTWPAFGLSAIFLLLFPTGRPLTARWRVVVWLSLSGVALSIIGEAIHPELRLGGFTNPVGIDAEVAAEAVFVAGICLIFTSLGAAVVSLLLRFRRAHGAERAQLKWLAFVVAAPVGVAAVAALLAAAVDRELAGTIIWMALLGTLIVGIPIATALAILRYRLYDIDVIIRRTLAYGVASVALAGVYLAIVLLLQEAFSSFAGGSDLAVAASTLAAFALFRPVRNRVQALVDRRFYRRKYDAQRTLEAFSARLRDEVELDALETDLAATVDETMRPAHVSVWLREPAR
jgi:hypothetical protein